MRIIWHHYRYPPYRDYRDNQPFEVRCDGVPEVDDCAGATRDEAVKRLKLNIATEAGRLRRRADELDAMLSEKLTFKKE